MLRTKIATFAFVFALLGMGQSSAETVRFGTVADFAPYNYLDDEGVVQGFEADLQTALCARANLECDWVPAPWDALLTGLAQGDFDVIMSAYQITEARKTLVDFSGPYLSAGPSAILVLNGGAVPSGGDIVGAQTGTLEAGYVTKNMWSLAEYATPADGIEALRNNQITAFIGDQAYLKGIAHANPDEFSLAASNLAIDGAIAMAVPKSNPVLLSTLDSALTSLKADGTLDTLIRRWFAGRESNYRAASE